MRERQGGSEDNVVTLPIADRAAHESVLNDERLEALRSALEDLRNEIRTRLPEAAGSSDESAGSNALALFDELRSRISTLGMTERSIGMDEFGMEHQSIKRAAPLLDFMLERCWRVEVSGTSNLPTTAPCLLVANRSGLLPYDGAMLSHIVSRLRPDDERPRFMVADWLITLPFVQPYLARLGGARACRENADRLLRHGHSLIAFPEGLQGAAKAFRDRYQLQDFGGAGAIRAAVENGAAILPVAVVGAEEAHPLLFKAQLPGRALGLPFLPVTPTFPALGALGLLPLPSKWVISIGRPVELDYGDPGAADDDLVVSRLTAELRSRIQALVDQGLERRESVWS